MQGSLVHRYDGAGIDGSITPKVEKEQLSFEEDHAPSMSAKDGFWVFSTQFLPSDNMVVSNKSNIFLT
jgi:hypothetical protein